MKNKILLKREALEASISTLTYQIVNLRIHCSKEQVRCWRVHRYNLKIQLAALPTEKQLQQGAKRVNFSNSSKIQKS